MFVAVAAAGEMKFQDCGHGEVKKLLVSDCSGDYCIIHKGKKLSMEADFVANQDSPTAVIKISAKVNGVELQVPGIETNGCHHMKCPLVKGQSYQFKYDMVIPQILPNVKADVTASLTGAHGLLACGTVHSEVEK
uniref:Group 2 allergen Sui p 2 n=1 Tax=Suidasia pontifica TaxID=2058792 RepID=A0A2H4Z439_9ACAR|nr:group 2 allergen Sui p 2 [Suidasia pontifica]